MLVKERNFKNFLFFQFTIPLPTLKLYIVLNGRITKANNGKKGKMQNVERNNEKPPGENVNSPLQS